MPPENAAAFEAEMLADESIQNEVELQRRTRQEIEYALYKDYRRKAAVWMTEMDQLPSPPDAAPVHWWQKYFRIVVLILWAAIIVFFLYRWLNPSPSETPTNARQQMEIDARDVGGGYEIPTNSEQQIQNYNENNFPTDSSIHNMESDIDHIGGFWKKLKKDSTASQGRLQRQTPKYSPPNREELKLPESTPTPARQEVRTDSIPNESPNIPLPPKEEQNTTTPKKALHKTVVALTPIQYAGKDFSEIAGKVDLRFRTQILNSKRVIIMTEPFAFSDIESGIRPMQTDPVLLKNNVKYLFSTALKGRSMDVIRQPTTGTLSYFCKLTVELRIIDTETATVIGAYVLKNPDYSYNRWQTHISPQAAENAAVEAIGMELHEVLKTFFPLQGWIMEIKEQDGQQAKTLLVDIGNQQNVQRGDVFVVIHERRMAAGTGGVDAISEIGEIVIKEVYGTSALASVRRGGESILRLANENAALLVRSKN